MTGSSTSYTVNSLNQYTSGSMTYDGNGNTLTDGPIFGSGNGYSYDAENRLISVRGGSITGGSYAYDSVGRRKTKNVNSLPIVTTNFVTDADNREVLEYNGSTGHIQTWYVFGLGPDEVLNQMNVAAGTRETMIPDIQGSVVGTLDSGTGTLTKAGFQPFGQNTTAVTGTFRYTGRRFDAETIGSSSQPSGLYYYRAREYSPTLGRFLQPDPVGYAGGDNLYAYVNNDPLNNTDPSGLCLPYCVTVPVGAALGVAGAYLSDPAHFTWKAAAIGATAGALTGLGIPAASSLVTGTSAAGIAARVAITVGGNFLAGSGGSVATDVAAGQNIDYGKAAAIGGVTAAAPLISGEAAIAGFGTGLAQAGDAALSSWMGVPSAVVAVPGSYLLNSQGSPNPNAIQSTSPDGGRT